MCNMLVLNLKCSVVDAEASGTPKDMIIFSSFKATEERIGVRGSGVVPVGEFLKSSGGDLN